jgi:hypothetical protein
MASRMASCPTCPAAAIRNPGPRPGAVLRRET